MDVSETGRIGELYHKSRTTGLTGEKKEEQTGLHREYIAVIRGNLRSSLSNIPIQEEDGSVTDLEKKRGDIKGV